MGTTAFRIDNLTVSLGQPPTEILRGVSLDVTQGETLALVGKSGSGKSTLVNVLSGLLTPTGGSIARSEGRFGELRTSTVFQTAHLFPWLSAVDNVAISMQLKNHPTRERNTSRRRTRAREIMAVLGIEELALRRSDELSGGEQQRVAIARAVAAEPDVLLLDEPFSALDVATRAALQEWLVEHRDDLAPTVVLVTHDLSEALYVADRIALLSSESGSLKVWSSDVRGRDDVVNSSVRAEIEERFFSMTSFS
jgi:ABC-type nitrate/sulfonate/bicarbonate transport system ATPase subunit